MLNLEGFGKGRIDPVYQGVDNGIPLLSSFHFRFEKAGSSDTVDNEINSIMILPAGEAEDLSPNADLNAPVVEAGKVTLVYRDHDADDAKDRYFYHISHSIHPFESARRFQIRDVGCKGKCEHPLPRIPGNIPGSSFDGEFVLIGFQLFFTGGRDHDIDKIAVFEKEGILTVEFNDGEDDDVFGYVVDFALVSRLGLNIQLGEENGTATANANVSLPQGQKVIRGFSFDFKPKDRHLREIGVLTSRENLEVLYADRSGKDSFQWQVRWAIIKPEVIAPDSTTNW